VEGHRSFRGFVKKGGVLFGAAANGPQPLTLGKEYADACEQQRSSAIRRARHRLARSGFTAQVDAAPITRLGSPL